MQDDRPITPGYARYVVLLFAAANVFNFLDRQLLAIALQPIKEELQVSDTAMGFLTGIAFALFYSTAGLPLARWADRGTRRTLMWLGIALWSGMTALCGAARSFAELAAARVGVGVGEAALTPAAHSLISDYFEPEQRARALAVYTIGAQLGLLVGLGLGGFAIDAWGWRTAFVAFGLPGLGIAALVRFTVREPARGRTEAGASLGEEDFGEVLAFLWRLPSFRHMAVGAALQAFFGYGFLGWAPTFLFRVHGLALSELALPLGVVLGVGGALGTYLGGQLTDRFGRADPRRYLRIPAAAAVAMAPFALLFYVPAVVLGNFYPAPTYATTQNLVRPRMRGLAASVLLLVINLVGLGLGPQLVGILNDALAPKWGDAAIRYSLSIVVVANLWGSAHYWMAARTLRADLRRKHDQPANR